MSTVHRSLVPTLRRLTGRVMAGTCLMILLSTGHASALMTDQKQLMDSGVSNFNLRDDATGSLCGAGAASGPVNLTGSTNEEKVWNYFISKGLKPYQAAGFMGNIKGENSPFDPTLTEGGGHSDVPQNGQGFGLIQWTFTPRQQPLVDRASAAGVKASDMGAQLEYVWYEITTGPAPYGGLLPKLQATTDVASATQLIESVYEVHAGGLQPFRTSQAQAFLAQFGSGSAADSGAGASTAGAACSGSGTLVGNLALPVEQKWYDQNKSWFTSPHHGNQQAVDIPIPTGTPVYSMTDGTVRAAPIDHGYGLGVEIDVGNGVYIKYAHGIDGGQIVHVGDKVKAGQLIMHSDNTGQSSGPHLHLEIDLSSSGYNGFNGTTVCPQTLLVALYEKQPAVPDFKSLPTSGCTTGVN